VSARYFLGLGKTKYNSNASLLTIENNKWSWETRLSERVERSKWSGSWPLKAIKALGALPNENITFAENSDIVNPWFKESLLQKKVPFYENLSNHGLENCVRENNQDMLYMAHHPAHAYSVIPVMPFEQAFILVCDGGGSKREDYKFDSIHEIQDEGDPEDIEHTSLYFWDGNQLRLFHKEWLKYKRSPFENLSFANSIGAYYEKVAEFIFNDNLASGKVMGLAGYGSSRELSESFWEDQMNIPWDKKFPGGLKSEWARSSHFEIWANEAATVQLAFERNLERLSEIVKENGFEHFGDCPLVMTGGCALNCTANFKLYKKGYFKDIFVSPFPGDESISLGLAVGAAIEKGHRFRDTCKWKNCHSAYGSDLELDDIKGLFKSYKVSKLSDYNIVAEKLRDGEVIAWLQGRSESGPRALGHRSLLANPLVTSLKEKLNEKIKFRESFRPYGASLLRERASEYFEVDESFENPSMSYAVAIRDKYRELLKEVSHIDGTCRMQTVSEGGNSEFYKLIEAFEKVSNIPVLLNTSLNIMGEPIVESKHDALSFFEHSVVKTMVIGHYLIEKV